MSRQVVLWFLLQEGLAWTAVLLARPLFGAWPDQAVGLSKAAGVIMLGGAVWVLGWISVPVFTRGAMWVLAALLAIGAIALQRRRGNALVPFPRTHPAEWLTAEVVWLLSAAAFGLIRAGHPDIVGGEKFMDFALLNAAIRSDRLPLYDPWLAGAPLQYYYFGYVAWAALARMLGTLPDVAYNLAVVSIPAAVTGSAYSIALALTHRRSLALGSAVGVVCAGTCAGALQIASVGGGYDIWSPSRVIPGTINEFPFFTFFWGDLHPHLLSMPILLLLCGLAVVALSGDSDRRRGMAVVALLGAAAGLALVTSVWDVVPCAIVVSAIVAVRAARFGVGPAALEAVCCTASALAMALPLALSVRGGPVHVGIASTHSPIGVFALVQGNWLAPVLLLAIVKGVTSAAGWRRAAVIVGAALAVALATRSPTTGGLVAAAATAWSAFIADRRAPWLFLATAATCLLLAECFYVDDIYGAALQRMNLVFKLHLHAYLLLGVTAGFCVREAWVQTAGRPALRGAFVSAVSIAAATGAVYPAGAIASLRLGTTPLTLGGTRHFGNARAGDLALIEFLNARVRGTSVIVEATSDPYSYSSRISANTGLPTVVGWANHERVWRRGDAAAAEIARLVESVRTVYEGDAAHALEILRALNVHYIVVGDFERHVYPAGNFAKFPAMGRTVFDARGTALIAIEDETRR